MERWLYHATFGSNIKSIKKFGLGAKQNKNWGISLDNVVYLSEDPFVAEDFCEAAEDISNTVYKSGIIVLAVKVSDLNINKLKPDSNISDSSLNYEYTEIIPTDKLFVISDEKGLVGKLLDLKRVPRFY